MVTVRRLLAEGNLPRLETQMLLQHVLKVPRSWLIAHDTEPLSDDAITRFQALVEQRTQGQPMAYLVGRREFMGHEFIVEPGVLIPRPETELLVETALADLQQRAKASRVLDLGTGSGAIAVSIALARPDATVVATDESAAALNIARRNAQLLDARVEFLRGDWYEAVISQAPFDVIVSNPPYIHGRDSHLEQGDLRYEPRAALTDEADGLSALATIIGGACAKLVPGGALWVEHGHDQAADVRDLLAQAGFKQINSRRDLAGIERISGGNL